MNGAGACSRLASKHTVCSDPGVGRREVEQEGNEWWGGGLWEDVRGMGDKGGIWGQVKEVYGRSRRGRGGGGGIWV